MEWNSYHQLILEGLQSDFEENKGVINTFPVGIDNSNEGVGMYKRYYSERMHIDWFIQYINATQ